MKFFTFHPHKMGRKRKDRSKDNYPAKNQATILNFKGFERSVQSSEPQEIKTPQFCCEFCGLSHCHDGARKKHQSSCDRKPVETKEFYCKKCTSVQPVDDATEVVLPILDEILNIVCKNKSGGWNLAKIFTIQPSKKKKSKKLNHHVEQKLAKQMKKLRQMLKKQKIMGPYQ